MMFLRRLFQPRAAAGPKKDKPSTAPLTEHASSKVTTATVPAVDMAGMPPALSITAPSTSGAPSVDTLPPEPFITPPSGSDVLDSDAFSLIDIDPSPTPAISGSNLFGVTRPLPPLEIQPMSRSKHLVYGLTSDIGQQRSNNQDSLLAFFAASVSVEERPDVGLFTVADGMGGHHDGEKASAIAVRTVAQHIMSKLYLELLATKNIDADRPTISEILSESIHQANTAVSEQVPEGGTTLTVAIIMGDLAYIGHVGDSRAYLITDKEVEQLTRDHSLVQRLVELDQLTPEEALSHPQHNVLYRAIGQSENLEVDGMMRRLPSGSRLLLCSDGLWNLVPQEMLIDIVRSAASPQDACDKLVATANARGGPDNITALIVQMPG
jgi:protein phosphatase